MSQAPRDDNRITSLLGKSDITGLTVPIGAKTFTGSFYALDVAIVDANGDQIVSFGSGTQYTDAGTPPAHPIGPTLLWNNGGTWAAVSAANPLPTTATVSTTGLATSAKQDTQITSLQSIDTKIPALGQALAAASVPVVLTAAQLSTLTPPASVTVTQATGTNLHTVVDSGTVTTVSTVTSLTQMNGQAISMGTGTRAAGTQRVTIATDDIVPASQSGTWTVQPGNTANTTPWLVSEQAKTAGGATPYKLVSAASTNATSVKGSAGQIYMITASNVNASARYLKLYNKASVPTVGTDTPVHTFIIPGNTAGAGTNIPVPDCGIEFTTGIAFALTTEATDVGSTGVAANEIVVNLAYK